MADAVKCCVCKHCDFGSNKCLVYPNGIPKDIFIQVKECSDYSKNEAKDKYDYPLATSGR